ncbi:MAG TPA: CDP-alcohol phosphatidyltransferase family protein [Vicinamibacterales bacterium]|jgi:phosphatidylglycerophosphate synthase
MVHTRANHSISAGFEKRLLVAIAAKLPASVSSDHLTTLALAAMVGAGVAFAFISRSPWFAVLVAAMMAVNWFGDSLDGTLARVRNQQRPRYGYYIDHVIDLGGTAALVGGMAASEVMTPAIAFVMLAAYLLVAAESFLGTHALGVFRMSFAGVGPTELRILLAIGAFKVAASPRVSLAGADLFLLDVAGVIAAIGLIAAFLVSAIRNGAALSAAEPRPARPGDDNRPS